MRVVELLFADTDKARRVFKRTTQGRPRIPLTIRQRMEVSDECTAQRDRVPDRGENFAKLPEPPQR
jgi:hypothetical protein